VDIALDLINSEEWYGRELRRRIDHLAQPEGVGGFLERWGFADVEAPTPAQEAQLLRLRELLRRMVTALAAGESPSDDDLDHLDRFLAGPTLRRHVTSGEGAYRLEVAPVRRDWAWVLSEASSSFAEILEGELERVKLCDNPECRWAFYDTTKNRRRRWCNAAECGNVFKVREFRARQRAAQAARDS
jgi:predicted RNA-binding Zn ribbon-like protein